MEIIQKKKIYLVESYGWNSQVMRVFEDPNDAEEYAKNVCPVACRVREVEITEAKPKTDIVEKMKLYKIKASIETVIAARSQGSAYTLIRDKRSKIEEAIIESIKNYNHPCINLMSQIEDISELPDGWESDEIPILCDEPQNFNTVGEILSQ